MISALFAAGILQGILLVVFLYRKNWHHATSKVLACLITLVIVHLGLVLFDTNDLFLKYPHFSRLSWLLPLLYGPLIILLTESIMLPEFRLGRRHFFLMIPFISYAVLLLPYFLKSAYEKQVYLSDTRTVFAADFGWMNHITNYLHIGFVSAALLIFYKWKNRKANAVQTENMVWLFQFLWIFLGILVFALFTFYSKKFQWAYLSGIYPGHFILAVLFIYWLGYKVLQGKNVLEEIKVKEETPEINKNKYAKTGLDTDTARTIAANLEHIMHSEKPYLNPDLTLADLSETMSVPKHQLSQVINSEFHMNFYEFVNGYRLIRFKSEVTIPSNAHLSLLGIAMECGFNSKAAFNQYFKKKEGITPTEFLKAMQRQLEK